MASHPLTILSVMAIARVPRVVIDCAEPRELADFYVGLLGWRVTRVEEDWITIRGEEGERMDFQRVEGFRAPSWPLQDVPQQMHIDLSVADLEVAEEAVLKLGAVKAEVQPGTSFTVFLDPAGHPFCLCLEH